MNKLNRLTFAVAALFIMSAGNSHVANAQPTPQPVEVTVRADVNNPLYSAPLDALLPQTKETIPTIPSINETINKVRRDSRSKIMKEQAARFILQPDIAPIVGGNIMAQVRAAVMQSLNKINDVNDVAEPDPNGIVPKIMPFIIDGDRPYQP